MAKFVIECPQCGKYAEAKTGFFSRKKIDCACGYTINVRTDKLSSRVCPHCGNSIVFDQSKGADAKCPVCKNPINTTAEQSKNVEFACGQCGIMLSTSKAAETHRCPVCDYLNVVAKQAASESLKNIDRPIDIKYEGDNKTFIWKHPAEDFCMGSQLIVHESQEAIFFKDGQALDLFGPGRYTLETQNLPMIGKLYKNVTATGSTFHCEVYFINLVTQMGVKWGTDTKVRLFDPASGMHVELGASGECNIRVLNSRKLLLKLVGTGDKLIRSEFFNEATGFFRSLIMTQVKSYLAGAIKEKAINVLEIDERLMELSESLRGLINKSLEDYGLTMPEFYVARIVTPDNDANFKRMKEQYAAQYLRVRDEEIKRKEAEAAAERKTVEAQTAAKMKIIDAQGDAEALKIKRQAEADAYRMQAEAEAMEMKMKGYTYAQETSRMVGVEAMKNGITGSGNGGSMVGDMAGLGMALGAVGSVVGMTKDIMNPVVESLNPQNASSTGVPMTDGWNCSCGAKGIASKFCPECGKSKPADAESWDCSCGAKGITSKFCPECGNPKPAAPESWDCSCGVKGIISKFCPECGAKRPEKNIWTCPNCGAADVTGKFCPECGTKIED